MVLINALKNRGVILNVPIYLHQGGWPLQVQQGAKRGKGSSLKKISTLRAFFNNQTVLLPSNCLLQAQEAGAWLTPILNSISTTTHDSVLWSSASKPPSQLWQVSVQLHHGTCASMQEGVCMKSSTTAHDSAQWPSASKPPSQVWQVWLQLHHIKMCWHARKSVCVCVLSVCMCVCCVPKPLMPSAVSDYPSGPRTQQHGVFSVCVDTQPFHSNVAACCFGNQDTMAIF